MGDKVDCKHENGVIVHRWREQMDKTIGRARLTQCPNHLWCPDCETAVPIAREAASG